MVFVQWEFKSVKEHGKHYFLLSNSKILPNAIPITKKLDSNAIINSLATLVQQKMEYMLEDLCLCYFSEWNAVDQIPIWKVTKM